MIRKLLVANRGEIARRVFRTCRSMGIGTVAVWSNPDRDSRHVAEADEAVALGSEAPGDSYLRIDLLVNAARTTGADAVHPGYGFLAENADFAQAVIHAGLTWIGPSAEAIRTMGSKLEAKALAQKAGVPVLDSVEITTGERAVDLQYPILIKASLGGGGRGMRIVENATDLDEAVASARREAAAAFGDDTLFAEPYLVGARHIEVQIAGDSHGNLVSLFERECSIQRRYQKIIEEAPSPAVDDELRTRLGQAAAALAREVDYEGVGTVEFLLDGGRFFFLEMNTRLQVEHPVTEEVTGLDLVALQILVAAGHPLPDEALEPAIVGHAIEARLYAEDPLRDYLPVSGRIDRFRFDEVAGLRVDSGVESGSTVPDQYDPLIAKIVAWGSTRTEAINLAAGALQRARLHGITTNRDLLVGVLRHPEFLAGRFDTSFLDRYPPGDLVGGRDREQLQWAAVAAALGRQARTRTQNTPLASIPSGWRNNPSGHQHVKFDSGNGVIDVGYRFDVRGGLSVTVDYRDVAEVSAPFIAPDRVGLQVGDHLRWFDINQVATVHHVDGPDGYTRLLELDRFPTATADEPPGSMHAPMPGRVVRVMVGEGDQVEEGEVLVVLEAMKMEHSLRSPLNGTVTEVRVAPGEQVNAGQTLIVVDQPS